MILDSVKTALRITTNAYDDELNILINAAKIDLGIAGVVLPETLDDICNEAIMVYCKLNFGVPEDADFLKKSYDEKKAQLSMASGYTDWGDSDV